MGAFPDGPNGVDNPSATGAGAAKEGAVMRYTTNQHSSYVFGTWTVTAP